MYAIAEKYDIAGLKALALEKYQIAFDRLHTNEFEEFLQVVPNIYRTPDTELGLRDLAVKLAVKSRDTLMHLARQREFRDTVAKYHNSPRILFLRLPRYSTPCGVVSVCSLKKSIATRVLLVGPGGESGKNGRPTSQSHNTTLRMAKLCVTIK